MKKPRSLIGTIQLSLWLLSSLLVVVLGFLWISAELNHSRLQQETIRTTALERQREKLRSEIDSIVAQVEYKIGQLEKKVRGEVKDRTEEGYSTALYIYERNKAHKSDAEIAKIIHDALFAASWDDGKGYYFAEDMQGTELINRNNPELEGQNILDVQDSNGKYIVRELLQVVNSEAREGYCTYSWNRPSAPGVLVPKISYVKFFAPLNWMIGTGTYLDDAANKIKQEVLLRLNNFQLTDGKYAFVGSFDGTSLAKPAKGKNMWDATDPNGVKIVQELIKQSQNGGGFVEYVMPKLAGQRPSPKLSYAKQVKGWDWYIGTGVYIDYIEDEIASAQKNTHDAIQKIIFKAVLVLFLFLLVSYLFSWVMSSKIKNNLSLFLEFLHESATKRISIPAEKVSFKEFRSLALSANQMVADRHLAWEELNAEQERLAVTLQSIGDGVMTTDTAGNVVLLNKVAEQLTGWSNTDAQGKASTKIFNIINENSGEKCLSPIQKVLETGEIVELENHTILLAKDGNRISIADSGAPIRNHAGEILGVVLVFRDVTNEQKIEEELLKIKKLESVGVLAGGIAHDFNNILFGIIGNIELASRRLDSEHKAFPLLIAAQKASSRAAKLTQQLLTFAKGGMPVKETSSVQQIIRDSADFTLHGSNVSCHYSYPDDLWNVDIDPGQIGQVVQNIVLNAKNAMPDGGQIEITCSNIDNISSISLPPQFSGSYVNITISDSGIGMAESILEKIFDPFFTTRTKGNGLGLAICHSIIGKHDGYIDVNSTVGIGTDFNIYLPALKTMAPEKRGDSTPKVLAEKSLKIMVMDDDEVLRSILASQLSYFGHETIMVDDGVEAIRKYKKIQVSGAPVDLIIMDLTVPGKMGGKEAVQEILAFDPAAKVIVSSGYSNDPIMARYEEYGFIAALSKPYEMDQLHNIVLSLG